VIPGEYLLESGDVIANAGRRTAELSVENTGDRPIQVGSHFHFFEVNRALRFDRALAFGMRLNVPAGTAVRFEPGDAKRVTLVELAGARRVFGLNGLTDGAAKDAALRKLAEWEQPPGAGHLRSEPAPRKLGDPEQPHPRSEPGSRGPRQ
jgi:urease beta subunit